MRPVPLCADATRRWQLLLRGGLLLVAVASGARPLFAHDHLEIARRVLSRTPLIDGHNDLPWKIRDPHGVLDGVRLYDLRARTPGHTDLERLRRGMVGGQFWSVYVSCRLAGSGAARVQLEQIAIVREIVASYPETFAMAGDASAIGTIFGERRIASLLGIEGAHTLEGSVVALRSFHDLGVRYVTLTHDCTNVFADAARDAAHHGGLSPLGMELVAEMNCLGVPVDLSYASPRTMHDALDTSVAPVIWSHASAHGVVAHPRNVPDDVLRRLPDNGGVVMITFVPTYVSRDHRDWAERESAEERRLENLYGAGDPRTRRGMEAWRRDNPMAPATLAQVADHIEHVRRVVGIDHVGIGGDFDGITQVVLGLEDVSTYPALFAELSRRAWTETELTKLAGENILRTMREAEAVVRML